MRKLMVGFILWSVIPSANAATLKSLPEPAKTIFIKSCLAQNTFTVSECLCHEFEILRRIKKISDITDKNINSLIKEVIPICSKAEVPAPPKRPPNNILILPADFKL